MEITTKALNKLMKLILPFTLIISQWIQFDRINLSWIIYAILCFIIIVKNKKLLKKTRIIVFSVFVVLWPLISYTLGQAAEFNINLYLSLLTGLICLVYISTLADNDFYYLLKGCGLACIVFSIWGFVEIYTGKYILFNRITDNILTYRLNQFGLHYPGVVFSNTNDLAQFLVLLFPCQYLLLKNKKTLNIIFGILTFFVLINTDSKLSVISFILIIILGYFIKLNISKKNNKIKYIMIGFIIFIIVLAINSYTGWLSKIVKQNFNINIDADYYVGRAKIYTTLLKASKSLPFGGFGTAYSIQDFRPHNLCLYILCDFGWMALILFLVWTYKIGKLIYKNIFFSHESFFYSLMFCELILFIIMSSVSSCNEQRKGIWIFMAICIKIISNKVFPEKDN